MTDRELLELAAKAAGIEVKRSRLDDPGAKDLLIFANRPNIENSIYVGWNPLIDDGDALRLAVELRLSIQHYNDMSQPLAWLRIEDRVGRWTHVGTTEFSAGPNAATRRAIVRAAAEIGKAMK